MRVISILFLLLPIAVHSQAFLSPEVEALSETSATQPQRLLITMVHQANLDSISAAWESTGFPLDKRPGALLSALREVAAPTQQRVLSYLSEHNVEYRLHRSLSIVNMLSIEVAPNQIELLAACPDVRSAVLDKSPYRLVKPVRAEPSAARSVGGSEVGLEAIGAPQMWALGYTGRGRLAYSVDTGIWPDHPAIKNQWKGHRFPQDECWLPWDRLTPGDKMSSHGTHTTGTILGLDSLTNDTIGAAFNAYFIATDPVVSDLADVRPLSDYVYTYEWCLNPDGNLNTSSDVPDAINNSWGRQPGEGAVYCDEDISLVFEVMELAGIANLSSAGNEGPSPQTMSVPHNINLNEVNTFTLGSINAYSSSYPISDFSSRGPSMCGGTGALLIKPEVVAPGSAVRSCVGQDEYAVYSGTSMACPHGVGAVLLLKEAFPYLPGKQLLEALYYSATDLGEPGEDNTYGNGLINVYDAYLYLINEGNTPVSPNQSNSDLVIVEVISPANSTTCSASFTPEILVKNAGADTINGFHISYGIIGQNMVLTDMDVVLFPGQEMSIVLPEYIATTGGMVELFFEAIRYEEVEEIDTNNNQIISRVSIKEQVAVPFTEDFEALGFDASLWHSVNDDFSKTWELFSTSGLDESVQSARMNLYDYSPRSSQTDYLVGPRVEFIETATYYLAFDVAYQSRPGPPITHDKLSVFTADHCDLNDLQLIYEKAGPALSTYAVTSHDFEPNTPEQWRREVIELGEFSSGSIVLPVFMSTNQKGNNLYLDNVAIYQEGDPLGISTESSFGALLYPNPARNSLHIRLDSWNGELSIDLYDALGRGIQSTTESSNSEHFQLSLQGLETGIYYVRLADSSGTGIFRVVKEK